MILNKYFKNNGLGLGSLILEDDASDLAAITARKDKEKKDRDLAWARNDKFNAFFKEKFPKEQQELKDQIWNMSIYGRNIPTIPKPELVGDDTLDTSAVLNWYKRMKQALSNVPDNNYGLGT